MPGVGFEPTWDCSRGILSPLRLPFRHPGQGSVPVRDRFFSSAWPLVAAEESRAIRRRVRQGSDVVGDRSTVQGSASRRPCATAFPVWTSDGSERSVSKSSWRGIGGTRVASGGTRSAPVPVLSGPGPHRAQRRTLDFRKCLRGLRTWAIHRFLDLPASPVRLQRPRRRGYATPTTARSVQSGCGR